MAKDVNIHVKTTGTQQTTSELNQVGHATEEMGAKTSRAGGWIKEAFTALVGPLGITAVVGLAVQAVRYYIAALDDMKRAAGTAVHDLANTQKTAGNYFEAFSAYSQKARTAALNQAYGVQSKYGLPLESSMQLLEAQQRTFGEVNPQSTEQFAAYWKLHAGASTGNLIRWMGASGIKTPEQQGQIMRMIGAAAQGKPEEQIIEAISGQSERFKALGWTPEETITNIGKLLKGMSAEEAPKALRGMFGSLEGFDEAKAIEMKAPKQVAESDPARLEWLKEKTAGLPLKQRNTLLRQAFGPTYPYIDKMLFQPTSPELQQELDYAASPQAEAEEAKNAADYLKTTEGRVETGAGIVGRSKSNVPPVETLKATLRDVGKGYLEELRYKNRLQYEKITWMNVGENREAEAAAVHLWFQTLSDDEKKAYIQKTEKEIGWGHYEKFPEQAARYQFEKLAPEEQLNKVENAANQLNIHYHNETIHNPVAGTAADRDIGPRADRDFK